MSTSNTARLCIRCPICYEQIDSLVRPAVATQCGHVFCTVCLTAHLRTSRNCPSCRSPTHGFLRIKLLGRRFTGESLSVEAHACASRLRDYLQQVPETANFSPEQCARLVQLFQDFTDAVEACYTGERLEPQIEALRDELHAIKTASSKLLEDKKLSAQLSRWDSMLLGEQRIILAVEKELDKNTRRQALLEFEKESCSLDIAQLEAERAREDAHHETLLRGLRHRLYTFTEEIGRGTLGVMGSGRS